MDYFFKKFLITQLWCISYPAILKTNLFSHHLSKCNFINSKFCGRLLAFFFVSLKRLDRILFKPHHTISMMFILVSEAFVTR